MAVDSNLVNLTFTDASYERLKALRVLTDSSGHADTIRRALKVLDIVVQARDRGEKIYTQSDDGTFKELELL
jgi:hypothetical protein